MSELLVASTHADAEAVDAVRQHHTVMAEALSSRVDALVSATASQNVAEAERARRDLVDWCGRELLPHAEAEEKTLYPAAHATTEGRLLVEAMTAEHQVIARLVLGVGTAGAPVRAAAAAAGLPAVFDSHLAKENDLVLPLLAAAPEVAVAQLLAGMHELLGDAPSPTRKAEGTEDMGTGCGDHACSCGERDGHGYPELDTRTIPHAIRHATVFGALESVRPGAGIELVASHDPVPLLRQIDQRWPDAFTIDYRERGPRTWRLTLTRDDA